MDSKFVQRVRLRVPPNRDETAHRSLSLLASGTVGQKVTILKLWDEA